MSVLRWTPIQRDTNPMPKLAHAIASHKSMPLQSGLSAGLFIALFNLLTIGKFADTHLSPRYAVGPCSLLDRVNLQTDET